MANPGPKPGPKSVDDPGWKYYTDVIEHAAKQARNALRGYEQVLACKPRYKFEGLLGDPPREQRLVLRFVDVEAVPGISSPGNRARLDDDWRDSLDVFIKGELAGQGELFVWELDLSDLFLPNPEAVTAPAPPPKQPVNSRRILKDEWAFQWMGAVVLRRENPNDLPSEIARKLPDLLEQHGQNVPDSDTLDRLVRQMFRLENMLANRPPQKPKRP